MPEYSLACQTDNEARVSVQDRAINHMGPVMDALETPAKSDFNTRKSSFPAGLDDVALIDGKSCSAAACISLSQWHSLVATGDAPKPAIRQPRYTRWLLTDVRTWLVQRVQKARMDHVTGAAVVAKARKASKLALMAKTRLRGANTAPVAQTVSQ